MRPVPKRAIGLVDGLGDRRVTVSACIELVLSQVPDMMDQMLDSLKPAVGLSMDKPAQKALLRPALQPVIKQLLSQRESLRTAFAGQVRVLAYGGLSDAGNRPLVRFEDIQLLDVHQLDKSIELARVQQELDFAVSDHLPRLNALMCTVMGWITVQPSINPLRPELFALALRDTMSAHISTADIRGEILGSAAGRLGVSLRQIYRELCEWLLSHDVEPAGLSPVAPSSVSAPRDPSKENETTRTVLTLERLRRLFSPDNSDVAALALRTGNNNFLHTIPASLIALQDMKQVEAMIKRLEQRKKLQLASSGNRAVQQVDLHRRAPMDGRELGIQIGEEVTRMMLDNLTQDDRLLTRVRGALQGLTPALLELARADVRFFSDHKHPARQFLDRVTDRSLAFTDEEDKGYARFLASIEDAVRAIDGSTAPKTVAFAEGLEALLAIWQKEDRVQIQLREEAARALLHIEQRNLLAQRLIEQWMHRMTDQPVPLLVRSFLIGPWAQVVAESQLNCTNGSADPQGYLAIVDELIWSVQPAQARRNPVRLVELIPGVLATLRSGLQIISFPPRRIAEFFDELLACHESVLVEARLARERAGILDPSVDVGYTVTDDTARQDEQDEVEGAMPSQAPWLGELEAAEAGYLDAEAVMPLDPSTLDVSGADQQLARAAIEAINEGTWVELMVDGQWTRLKLTWSSPHRTLLMFTSMNGRAHSMSGRSMAKLLANGMIRIVSAGLIVDGALDAVAQTAMRNSVAADTAKGERKADSPTP